MEKILCITDINSAHSFSRECRRQVNFAHSDWFLANCIIFGQFWLVNGLGYPGSRKERKSVREFKIMATANDKQWQKDAADQNFDYMFKLLIIGNSAVGKTSFLFRYADDSFTSAFVSTVGIDFKVKTVFRNEKRVKLQIWDTGRFVNFLLGFFSFLDCFWGVSILFYSWAREISHYHDCLLSRSNGIYPDVWHYERRVISGCSRLVRIFLMYLSMVILFKLSFSPLVMVFFLEQQRLKLPIFETDFRCTFITILDLVCRSSLRKPSLLFPIQRAEPARKTWTSFDNIFINASTL